jgi:hypothetical protein
MVPYQEESVALYSVDFYLLREKVQVLFLSLDKKTSDNFTIILARHHE